MDTAKKRDAPLDQKVNEKKWSKELMAGGWTVIPNIIFERQQALGLDPTDINILLHLASYWWKPGDKPHPSKSTIAAAIGIDPRTVQRRIAQMEKGGFIKREQRRVRGVGSKTNIYHLEGLIDAAKPFAAEKVEEQKKRAADRAARASRKGRPNLRVVANNEK
jgi:DNA-binding transcriptional regulator YhcF (GntR family)